ncbi:hypothetical protein Syun_000123 [Stephania yunnanensis]|uniref:Sororin C-terminal region domain-containing protein n=1 Tax=Stephania yunnanensis TaxID=152371 RepID=A0AAP0LBD6_9MAGN
MEVDQRQRRNPKRKPLSDRTNFNSTTLHPISNNKKTKKNKPLLLLHPATRIPRQPPEVENSSSVKDDDASTGSNVPPSPHTVSPLLLLRRNPWWLILCTTGGLLWTDQRIRESKSWRLCRSVVLSRKNQEYRKCLFSTSEQHTLPQDFIDKQRAYFAEVDAFELLEEEASENEMEELNRATNAVATDSTNQ